MIQWTDHNVENDNYIAVENGKEVGYVAHNDENAKFYSNKYYVVITTTDRSLFLVGYFDDFQLAKDVLQLALNENKNWEWWIFNSRKWLNENVSQV